LIGIVLNLRPLSVTAIFTIVWFMNLEVFPSFSIFFKFFLQCFVVFTEGVFYLVVRFIPGIYTE
jgi:hypothetical protein